MNYVVKMRGFPADLREKKQTNKQTTATHVTQNSKDYIYQESKQIFPK